MAKVHVERVDDYFAYRCMVCFGVWSSCALGAPCPHCAGERGPAGATGIAQVKVGGFAVPAGPEKTPVFELLGVTTSKDMRLRVEALLAEVGALRDRAATAENARDALPGLEAAIHDVLVMERALIAAERPENLERVLDVMRHQGLEAQKACDLARQIRERMRVRRER